MSQLPKRTSLKGLVSSRFVMVDGVRTHFLDGGDGPTVVLLHAGGFGENAEISWEFNIPALVNAGYRVVAPDWMGFGQTDKIRDFVSGNARMLQHMSHFCEVLCIDEAPFVGLSMGGTFLVRTMASPRPMLPASKMVLVSGGGFSPANEARDDLQNYDMTFEGMKKVIRAVYHDPAWADDDETVQKHYEASLVPGAWEFAASARFKSPVATPRSDFGNEDTTPYESIAVPTLLTAGADDKLRVPGYAHELYERIPNAEVKVFDNSGHCPNVEFPDEWNALVLDFLGREETGGRDHSDSGRPST